MSNAIVITIVIISVILLIGLVLAWVFVPKKACSSCQSAASAASAPATASETAASKVIQSEEEFEKAISQTIAGSFVAVTVPWCGYCKRLQPEWTQLRHTAPMSMNLIQVNGEKIPKFSQRAGIAGYPTLLLLNRDGTSVVETYNGPRTAEAMGKWLMNRPREPGVYTPGSINNAKPAPAE